MPKMIKKVSKNTIIFTNLSLFIKNLSCKFVFLVYYNPLIRLKQLKNKL